MLPKNAWRDPQRARQPAMDGGWRVAHPPARAGRAWHARRTCSSACPSRVTCTDAQQFRNRGYNDVTELMVARSAGLRPHRKVIFASSLGTVFEWYDFYLYATLAPFFAALFFPKGNDDRCVARELRDLRRGLLGAALRRARVRSHRRSWSAASTRSSSRSSMMGFSTALGRSPAHLRVASACRAPTILVAAAARCRASRSAANTAAPRPTSPSTRPKTARSAHELDPDHRHARLLPVADRDRPVPLAWSTRRTSRRWGWRLPFLVSLVLLAVSVYIRLKLNESPVFLQMKAEGKTQQGPAEGDLRQLGEPQDRAACRCSARPRARAWSGTRASSTRCSS